MFEELTKACEPYGYKVYWLFDEIHIRTLYEHWYFLPKNSGKVRLMHMGKCRGRSRKSEWHEQFHEYISMQDLATYIHEHEVAKYTHQFVYFSFAKDGKAVM